MATLLLRHIPKLRPSLSVHFNKHYVCKSNNLIFQNYFTPRFYANKPTENVTLQQKLKKAIAEYGSTVIVFHVTISLASLGLSYLLVSSGLDVEKYIALIGVDSEKIPKLASEAGTFVVAYAVHKVFAPARIIVTLTATPFIVRYLRSIGFLKNKMK